MDPVIAASLISALAVLAASMFTQLISQRGLRAQLESNERLEEKRGSREQEARLAEKADAQSLADQKAADAVAELIFSQLRRMGDIPKDAQAHYLEEDAREEIGSLVLAVRRELLRSTVSEFRQRLTLLMKEIPNYEEFVIETWYLPFPQLTNMLELGAGVASDYYRSGGGRDSDSAWAEFAAHLQRIEGSREASRVASLEALRSRVESARRLSDKNQ